MTIHIEDDDYDDDDEIQIPKSHEKTVKLQENKIQ